MDSCQSLAVKFTFGLIQQSGRGLNPASHPESSRWKLSRQLCEALGWRQANRALRDVVCRGLLLMLERAGEIELPAVHWQIRNQRRTTRMRPQSVLIDPTPVQGSLEELGPIEIQQVRRTAEESLFNSLLEQYHYLGYEQPVGEHLKYVVWAGARPLACLAWSSAPRHLGAAIVSSAGIPPRGSSTFT